ncbi:hypothetical protein P7C73_g4870, partial [Tremellales sp. Uapishka_1]
MSTTILWNSAALNALKRHQLVALCKKHGLKASGKNIALVSRLQKYASALPGSLQIHLPGPSSAATSDVEPPSPISSSSASTLSNLPQPPSGSPAVRRRSGNNSYSRPSDAWEVLSEADASLVAPAQSTNIPKSSSVNSWKSAGNGESLNEFGVSSSLSTVKALGSSLKRSLSRNLLQSRSVSASSHLTAEPEPEPEPEEGLLSNPPSPASTVGIPRRHSTLSLLERPSTIRLVSPPPPENPVDKEDNDQLPYFGSAKKLHGVGARRSLAPLRSPMGADIGLNTHPLNRKSMPALASSTSASISRVYPPLPHIPDLHRMDANAVPGGYPSTHPSAKAAFVFGRQGDQGITNEHFNEAAKSVLAEMNAKMGDKVPRFNEELLKGKQADPDRLVKVNTALGTGGWGLGATIVGDKKDRYAEAHEREFAKMQSLSKSQKAQKASMAATKQSSGSSLLAQTPGKRKLVASSSNLALNAALPPLSSNDREESDRQAKRSRLSPGPNYLGTLKDAGKSIANLLGDDTKRERARSGIVNGKGTSAKFGFMRKFRKAPLTEPTPTHELPPSEKKFDVPGSLRRSATSSRLPTSLDGPSPPSIARSPSAARGLDSKAISAVDGRLPKDRGRSTSAQTILTASSRIRPRSKLPDFGSAPAPSAASSMSSTNALGLPKSTSSSLSSSLRKQSQAEIIKNARPVPPPPSELKTAPPPSSFLSHRSSTLYAPTASSLARMQATIRPSGSRPLPRPPNDAMVMSPPQTPAPSTSITTPFGTASSRTNEFETNFNLPKPVSHPSPRTTTGLKTPSSKMRARAKNSGLSAVKSGKDLRGAMEMQARRAELRAKQERITQERQLREMLGDGDIVMG